MPAPVKARILAALRDRISGKLEDLVASQRTVQAGAIHEETRQEDPKDTRAIEAQYLARGLAERVEALRVTQATLSTLRLRSFGPDDPVALTALVTTTDESGVERFYFLAPPGCSESLSVDGALVQVLTGESPLGRALAGQCEGEEIEIELPSGPIRTEISSVH